MNSPVGKLFFSSLVSSSLSCSMYWGNPATGGPCWKYLAVYEGHTRLFLSPLGYLMPEPCILTSSLPWINYPRGLFLGESMQFGLSAS